MPTMEEFARQVEHLEARHLETILRELASNAVLNNPPISPTIRFLRYGVSAEILRFYLGNSWTNEVIFPQGSPTKATLDLRRNLRTESTTVADQRYQAARVIWIAELIFNLARRPYFDAKRDAIQRKNDLFGLLGEFEAAALFASKEFNLSFKIPSGIKGQDYEFAIAPSGSSQEIACEAKSRADHLEYSETTLKNWLRDARSQLPAGKPGIIVYHCPPSSGMHPNWFASFQGCAHRFLRGTTRVVAVFAVWHQRDEIGGGEYWLPRHFSFWNAHSAHYSPALRRVVRRAGIWRNPDWLSINGLVHDLFPDLPKEWWHESA